MLGGLTANASGDGDQGKSPFGVLLGPQACVTVALLSDQAQ